MEELGDLTQCYNQQGYCIGRYDRIRWPVDMNIGSTCTTDIEPFARIHNSHNIHKEWRQDRHITRGARDMMVIAVDTQQSTGVVAGTKGEASLKEWYVRIYCQHKRVTYYHTKLIVCCAYIIFVWGNIIQQLQFNTYTTINTKKYDQYIHNNQPLRYDCA